MEAFASEKSANVYGPDLWSPAEMFHAVCDGVASIKRPMSTPTGGGVR